MLLGDYLLKVRDYIFEPDDMLSTPLVHFYGVCERKHESLIFAEPLNVISSLLFFIAAWAIFRICRNHPEIKFEKKIDIHVLNFLMFAIGLSSMIFHMAPSKYTELLDITFIVIFINLYFLSFLIRMAKLKAFAIIVCFIALTGFSHMLVSQFPHAMNDSIAYLSTVITIVFMAIFLKKKHRAGARDFMIAAILGVISLTFRSIDNYVCHEISFGTHFIWHTLNAAIIFILMNQLVKSINRRARMLRMASLALG